MKDFDVLLQEDIGAYEGRHDDLIYQAPALYRLLTHLLDDPRLPVRLRPLVLVTISYFILPADIIPESLEGPYGYVDDIWLCAYTLNQVRHELGDEILVGNWDGEAPLVALVEDILAHEKDLLGDKAPLILEYVGVEYLQSAG